jgi:hypothetical protein
MVSKLNKSLDSLRSVVPALNAATDEANRLVKTVEHVLVDELAIGISTPSGRFRAYGHRDIDANSNSTNEQVREYLAFGRVNGTYCICVTKDTYCRDQCGDFSEHVDSEKTAWSACDRETRLRTFEDLPLLIERIVSEADRLTSMGVATAARVKELIADDNEATPVAETEMTTECDSIDPHKPIPVEAEISIARIAHGIRPICAGFEDTTAKAAKKVRSQRAAFDAGKLAIAITKVNETQKSSAQK